MRKHAAVPRGISASLHSRRHDFFFPLSLAQAAPVDTLPIFVRGGSIIPTGPKVWTSVDIVVTTHSLALIRFAVAGVHYSRLSRMLRMPADIASTLT